MTPNTAHKRAERQRRKEAGESRVEVWISADMRAALADLATREGKSTNAVALEAIRLRLGVEEVERYAPDVGDAPGELVRHADLIEAMKETGK